MNKVFVVNYKESTIDENGVFNVESGICDYGYKNEEDAIKQVKELAKEKIDECIDELGYEVDDVDHTENENGDCHTISCGSNTYDFWVTNLEII